MSNAQKFNPSLLNADWEGDVIAAPRYKELANHYLTLNNSIQTSLMEEYEDKHIPLQVQSSRPKKA